MNITILDNREIIIKTSDAFGTQNENKATVFNFSFPESLINANKKIVFITDDGVYWDLITNNSYKITNAVTKYKTVSAYVWLVDVEKDIDFRSKSWKITFNKNEEPDDVVPTEEEISGFDTMIAQLNTAIAEVDNIDIDAEKVGDTATVTITNKQGTQKSVEIKDGSDYIITEDDYREIANIVEADLPENYYNKTETNNLLDSKVDKETGKALIETSKIEKLDGIETGAEVNVVEDIKVNGTSLEVEEKAVNIPVPTELKDLTDDSTHRTVTDTEKTTWNNKADISDIPDVSGFITKDVNNLTNYTLKTATGSLIDLEINSSNYVVSLSLKDIDGNVISTDTIDLPLESVVVGGSYDAINKKIVLTLENGNTVDIPVGDLIAGLQTEITSQNKLASDLVDDSNSGNKFVNTSEKQAWNAKYDKPAGGIPKTDLASSIGASLDKADSAIQEADLADYVKNTDYATSSKAGVIKTSGDVGTQGNTTTGVISAATKTYAQYQSAANNLFIGKGTLENVITGKNLETADNKVTEIDENSTDTEYPSAKAVYEENKLIKDQIPNGTAEGTNVQITDSSNLPIEDGRLKGATSQQQYEGYNLWNGTRRVINGTVVDEVVETTALSYHGWFNVYSNQAISLSANQDYYLSCEIRIKSGSAEKLNYFRPTDYPADSTKVFVQNPNLSSNYQRFICKVTVTTAVEVGVLGFQITDGTDAVLECKNFMISTTNATYEPYTGGQPSPSPDYKQDVHTVTGDCEVEVVNENLWDEEWELGGINNDTGELETVSNFIRTKNYISVDLNTTYYRTPSNESTRIFFYTKEKNYISNLAIENIGGTFTTPNNAKYMLFKQYGTTYNNDIAIIKGNSGTYTPHAHQTFPISLGDIELCKIGDYQDYLYKSNNKWYLHKIIGKVVLDGVTNTLNYIKQGNTVDAGAKYINNILTPINHFSDVGKVLNSHFKAYPIDVIINNKLIGVAVRVDKVVTFSFGENENFNTTEKINNWLSTNNITLYYALANSQDTEITDTTLIAQLEAYYNSSTYRNVTNIITAGDDLAPIASIVYKKDLTTLFNRLDSLEARVDLLE